MSMADALGWSGLLDRRQQCDGVPVRMVPTSEPAPTLTGIAGSKGQWLVKRERSGDRSEETFDASGPAQALTSKARSWEVRTNNATSTGGMYKRGAGEAAPTVTSRTDLWRVLPSWPFHQHSEVGIGICHGNVT